MYSQRRLIKWPPCAFNWNSQKHIDLIKIHRTSRETRPSGLIKHLYKNEFKNQKTQRTHFSPRAGIDASRGRLVDDDLRGFADGRVPRDGYHHVDGEVDRNQVGHGVFLCVECTQYSLPGRYTNTARPVQVVYPALQIIYDTFII